MVEAELTSPFGRHQHRALKDCGLFEEQIVELGKAVQKLRAIKSLPKAKTPTRTEFHQRLVVTRKALEEALKVLEDLKCEAGSRDISISVLAISTTRERGPRQEIAIDLLRHLVAGYRADEEEAKCEPQRRQHADHHPIADLVEAINWGLIRHHNRNSPTFPTIPQPADWLVAPEKNVAVGRWPKEHNLPKIDPDGKFGRIAAVCYEAAGFLSFPKRAIRQYLERMPLLEHLCRARMGMPDAAAGRRKAGRPRKEMGTSARTRKSARGAIST